MKPIPNAVQWGTAYMFVYVFSFLLMLPGIISTLLSLAAPFVLVYMALSIIREPYDTKKTFDSHFYQDAEIKRVSDIE